MKLYSYFRSSAAYRVRIALNLKSVDADYDYVHLVRDGGAQHKPAYKSLNPQAVLPTLVLDGGEVLTQSLAIIEYLDETYPDPPLLPRDPVARAERAHSGAAIACDIHPLNNLRVLQYLKNELGLGQPAVETWYRHWVALGFDAVEQMIEGGDFCFGNTVSLADVCLLPQIFNARRFDVDMDAYPRISAVERNCATMAAFEKAHPANQPDSE